MLIKNVYILYPAGWGGTFIDWAINASDVDNSKFTVANPVTVNTTAETGGAGTAHLHKKIPTHQGLSTHFHWVIYNKPTKKQVYTLNSDWSIAIPQLLRCDPDGVFICIHDDNDLLENSFGRINEIIKWPTHLYTLRYLRSKRYKETDIYFVHPTFDPYNCQNDILFRNWVLYKGDGAFFSYSPVDYAKLDEEVSVLQAWYDGRNSKQPHEVNEQSYIPKLDYSGRIFEISLKELFSDRFTNWFNRFMIDSGVSDDFSTDQVEEISPIYLNAQKNLQWFESMDNWKKTGKFDSFISSHSIIEAEAIRHMLRLKPELNTTTSTGAPFSDWDVKTAQEISDRHFTSDDFK